MDTRLTKSWQCALETVDASGILAYPQRSTAMTSREHSAQHWWGHTWMATSSAELPNTKVIRSYWQSPAKASKMAMGLEHASWGKAERIRTVQPGKDSKVSYQHIEIHFNIRDDFFTVRVPEHWHKLRREVAESPCLRDTQKPSGYSPG